MDEKETLQQLNRMADRLAAVETAVNGNDWDKVEKLLADAGDIEKKIRANPVTIETMTARDKDFETEYTAVKEKMLAQVARNQSLIETWKEQQSAKISSSRNTQNVMDNISKFYPQQKTSFYIDKKE